MLAACTLVPEAAAQEPPPERAEYVVVLAEFWESDRLHLFQMGTGEPLGILARGEPVRGPIGMRLGDDGRLYVANATTSNVVRLIPESGEGEIFADEGLKNPYDLTFGPDGRLYVTSLGGNEVVRFDGNTGELIGTFASGGGLDWPEGLAFGPDGDLYVSSNRSNQVLRYDGVTGAFVEALDTSPSTSADGAPGDTLAAPAGLLFDEAGRLLIASTNNHAVFRYDDGALETLIPPETAGLRNPRLMAIGPDGLLWISAGQRLLRFDPDTGAFVDEFASTEESVSTGFVFVRFAE